MVRLAYGLNGISTGRPRRVWSTSSWKVWPVSEVDGGLAAPGLRQALFGLLDGVSVGYWVGWGKFNDKGRSLKKVVGGA